MEYLNDSGGKLALEDGAIVSQGSGLTINLDKFVSGASTYADLQIKLSSNYLGSYSTIDDIE